jgi:hypothetical protein
LTEGTCLKVSFLCELKRVSKTVKMMKFTYGYTAVSEIKSYNDPSRSATNLTTARTSIAGSCTAATEQVFKPSSSAK